MSNVPPPPPQDPNQPPQGVPQQPQYGAPQQPQYGAPQQGQYQQPQYSAPQPGQYQQPYGAPQAGYPDGGLGNLQINLWLSVFFTWIPALIFYLIDKDKTGDPVRKANVDNFNFQLIRTIVGVAIVVVGYIPFVGGILGILLWLVSVGLFVIAIIHAVQVPAAIRQGRPAKYVFTVNWVK